MAVRFDGPCGYTPRYHGQSHFPWAELECKTGLVFDEEQRAEIYHIFECYEDSLEGWRQAVRKDQVEQLRSDFLKLLERFNGLHQSAYDDDDVSAVFDTMCWMFDGGNLRKRMDALRDAAAEVEVILRKGPDEFGLRTPKRDIRNPEAIALQTLMELLDRAVISTDSTKGQTLGLHMGRRSVSLRNFVSVLCDRAVSEDEIRNAREALKRRQRVISVGEES